LIIRFPNGGRKKKDIWKEKRKRTAHNIRKGGIMIEFSTGLKPEREGKGGLGKGGGKEEKGAAFPERRRGGGD